MIYTVTLNPSLDYIVRTKRFSAGEINRTESEANLSRWKRRQCFDCIKNLGISSKILGFCAGFSGKEICRMLEQYGCDCDFVSAKQAFPAST